MEVLAAAEARCLDLLVCHVAPILSHPEDLPFTSLAPASYPSTDPRSLLVVGLDGNTKCLPWPDVTTTACPLSPAPFFFTLTTPSSAMPCLRPSRPYRSYPIRIDGVSSSTDSSTVSSTGPETRKQPTYTTVGSIYNPDAAAPLHPPTRRPRTRRFPQPLRPPSRSSCFPFPDALLSVLPLGNKAGDSPLTTEATFRRYSPLQQNYDRAVSPVTERERPVPAHIAMSVPDISLGNLPSPTAFDADDNGVSENTLASSRITIKGLTNLASYPNPVQKAAKKTLARARAANVGSSRPNTPSSFPYAASAFRGDGLPSSYGTTSGPAGLPQPLTAGPPGQRQFRPSTLEAAVRTFHRDDPAARVPSVPATFLPPVSSIGPPYNAGASLRPASDRHNGPGDTEQPLQSLTHSANPALVSQIPSDTASSRLLSTPGSLETAPEYSERTNRKIQDTLPPEKISTYYPNGFPCNYSGRHRLLYGKQPTEYRRTADQSVQESPSKRRSNVNQTFYAGSGGLFKDLDEIVRDQKSQTLRNAIGVIGEERERLRECYVEDQRGDGEIRPPHLSVEEAIRMDRQDVARPLVNMAFVTLLSYKDGGKLGTPTQNIWSTGFMEAEDAWIDRTAEGNRSFFSSGREERLSKRLPGKLRPGH